MSKAKQHGGARKGGSVVKSAYSSVRGPSSCPSTLETQLITTCNDDFML